MVSLTVLSAFPCAAEPAADAPQHLSIGIPNHLSAGSDAAQGAGEDGQSLFSPSYEVGRFTVRGGRINPSFGLAWDKATGLYGTDMGTDPTSSDLYSFSSGLRFDPPGWGTHTVSGQTVVPDGTPRGSFAIRNPDSIGQPPADAEGGDPSSFNLIFEGGRFPILPELTYRFALINPSDGTAAAEKGAGFAAGLSTRFDLGQGLSISPAIEAARLNDPVGTRDRERQYWSTSMMTEWRNWNFGLTYTQRETEDPAAEAIREYQAQASLGYVFDFGLSADLGWYRMKEEDASTDQFGFRFTYPFGIGK